VRATLVTTRTNQFGGVLGTAYRQAGGPPFSSIVVLPERDDLSWTLREQAYAARRMFGFQGTLRMLRYRFAGSLLSPAERDFGIGSKWLDSVSSSETQLLALNNINSAESAARIQELTPDVLVSIGTPTILKRHVLEIPTWGSVNLHNGRLPRYRGHFATFWEKLCDEEWGYVSLHEMVAQVDAGRMLATARIRLRDTDTMLDALLQKKQLGGQLLADLIRDVAAGKDVRQASPVMDGSPADESGYFGWPKIDDLRNLRWNTSRKAA
jgi:folate-dependent phosphoribosylglycinamide formyltransferase PurN